MIVIMAEPTHLAGTGKGRERGAVPVVPVPCEVVGKVAGQTGRSSQRRGVLAPLLSAHLAAS